MIKDKITKKNIVLLAILFLTFCISFIIFVSNNKRYTLLSFQYYYELEKKIVLEDRYVLLKGDYKNRAETIVDELLLGPHSIFNQKLLPFDTKYNSFYIRNKVAYLDLPSHIIDFYNDKNFTIEESVNLLKSNILRNINKIKSVIVTFDGQLLGAGPSSNELPQVKLD